MEQSAEKSHSSGPDLSEVLTRLTSNPELLSGIVSALSAGSEPKAPSVEQSMSSEDNTEPAASEASANQESVSASSSPAPDAVAALRPLLSALSTAKSATNFKQPKDDRSRLLLALRPYVSEGRREAIDYILQISQVTDLIRSLS